MQDVNLRQMFDAFCATYAPAQELMRERQAARAT
jgi:hypothetical protein